MAGRLAAPHPGSDSPTGPRRSPASWPERLSPLPTPALLIAIAALTAWRSEAVWNPPGLLATLNVLFLTVVSLGVSLLAARGFLSEHSSPSLLLGTGALSLGMGALLAASGLAGSDANSLVTVYNTSACVAGLCHLASALSVQGSGLRDWRPARVILACSYVGVLLVLAALVLLVRARIWPTYFVEGSGQTLAGTIVLWMAAALFALSALHMSLRARGTPLGVLRWYSGGLWLIGVGLLGVSLQQNLGDALNWVGRSGQYLGGVYMLVAALSSIRSSGHWMLPVERALRQSQQRWAATLSSIGEGVIATDLAGRITFMNAMAERLTGWATDEALARPIAEVFRVEREHARQRQQNPATGASQGATTDGQAGGSILVRRDGAELPVDDVSAPIRDEAGQTTGAVLIFRDITERRQAETEREQLLAREQSLRYALQVRQAQLQEQARLLDLAHVLVRDAADRIISWNSGAAALYGFSSEEAMGQVSHALLQTVFAESREAVARALREQGHWQGELTHRAKDGRKIVVASHQVLYRDDQGRPIAILEVNNDVTERRQAEERIAHQNAILDGVNRILFGALDEGSDGAFGRICLAIVERVTESSFGFIGEIGPSGRLDNLAISGPGWEACQMEMPSGQRRPPLGFAIHGIYGRVFLDGQGFFTNDPASHPDSIGTPSGHPPILSFLGVPLKRGEETLGMIAVANRPGGYRAEDQEALEALAPVLVQALLHRRARQERDRLLAAEKEARAEAEAAVRMREEFISIAAHELRTPVTSLLGYSQMLMRQHARTGTFDAARVARGMDNIDRQSRRLTRLADQLLNFSRLEAGRLAINTEATDLSQLVVSAVDEAQQASPSRELRLETRGEVIAAADPLRLSQVVVNLLDNALKFSPPDTPVDVSLESDGDTAVLSVRDYGMGIAPEKRALIFDRFYQAHDERHYGGMGIGLYISREIVHLHGGTIAVESPKSGGSRFVVRLPIHRGPRAASLVAEHGVAE